MSIWVFCIGFCSSICSESSRDYFRCSGVHFFHESMEFTFFLLNRWLSSGTVPYRRGGTTDGTVRESWKLDRITTAYFLFEGAVLLFLYPHSQIFNKIRSLSSPVFIARGTNITDLKHHFFQSTFCATNKSVSTIRLHEKHPFLYVVVFIGKFIAATI